MTRSFGLRAALTLLVLIAIAPVFAVVVLSSLAEQEARLERSERSLRSLVALSAAHQDSLVEGARQMLTAIALSPPVAEGDVASCATYLRQLQARYPTDFGTFGVLDTEGRLACRGSGTANGVVSNDRPFFRAAVQTGRFSVGEYTVSRASGRAVLPFGMPVYQDERRVLRGVAYVALDLERTGERLRDMDVPPEMALMVTDANAVVLAASSGAPTAVGARLGAGFVQRAIASGELQLERKTGDDGRQWLLAVQPVGRAGEARLFVAGTAAADDVLAPATRRLRLQLLALGLITLAGAGAAWAFGDRVLARPLRRLLSRVDGLDQETLRLDIPSAPGALREISDLDRRFSDMAQRLAERAIQRDGALAEMAHQKDLLESVLASMAEGVLVVDPRVRFLLTNRAAARILPGLQQSERDGSIKGWRDGQDVYLLDGVTRCPPPERPDNRALGGESVENFRYLVHGELSGGELKMVQGSARPLRAPDGQITGAVVVLSDATAAWRAEKALVESERRYRTLFESNPHPMWVLDERSGRFLTVNDAAVDHYAFSRNEFLAMRIGDIDENPDGAEPPAAERMAVPRITRHRRKNGPPIAVEISSHALEYGGRAARMVLALDVTLRLEAEAEMKRLNDTLEQRVAERTRELALANQELESFSYSVSHDLRAPLQIIDGFAQALMAKEQALDAKSRHYLDRIAFNARQMGQLIDDLLALARVTRAELQIEPCDLAPQAWQVLASLRERFPDREVQVEVDEALPCRGDGRLLGVVLVNLIDNAWKFTARTGQARIRIARGPDQGGDPSFVVEDNGAGFDSAYADRLFQPFQRLHSVAEFAGTGIGLATVHRIVSRHGGRVWAEGQLGQGASFRFSLPADTRQNS